MNIKDKAIEWFSHKVEWFSKNKPPQYGTEEKRLYDCAMDAYQAGYRAGRRAKVKTLRE